MENTNVGVRSPEIHLAWGKFFLIGVISLLLTGAFLFLQENQLVQAKLTIPQEIEVIPAREGVLFSRSKDGFSVDTSRVNREITVKFYGEDEIHIAPGSKITGKLFPEEPPRVLIEIEKGELQAFRLSSFPLIEIIAKPRVVFPGKGVVRVDNQTITPIQYPVFVSEFPPEGDTWISPLHPLVNLRLTLPVPDDNALKEVQKRIQEKASFLEKASLERGFHFRKPDGFKFFLAKSINGMAQAFSFDEKRDQRRNEKLIEELMEDSLFAITLHDPTGARERIEKAFSLQPHLPARFIQKFSFVPFDHRLRLLDQEIRAFTLGRTSDENWTLIALLQGLYDHADFERLGFSIQEQRGNLIVFGEQLRKLPDSPLKQKVTPVLERFFASLTSDPRYFDPLYLKMLLALQEDLDGDFEEDQRRLFALGKKFLEDEKIPLAQGREALLLILGENGALREKLIKEESRLISFLFSPEGQSVGTYREQFAAFIEREEEAQKIREIVGEEKQREVRSAADVFRTLLTDFKGAGIHIEEVVPVEDEPGLLLIKRAILAGTPFSAIYDGIQKIFLKLEVEGETYDRSISLERFSAFFFTVTRKKKGEAEAPPPREPEVPTETSVSRLERVAKAKALEKLALLGIDAKDTDLRLKDLENLLFLVSNVRLTFATGNTVRVSFEFFTNTNEVQNVEVPSALGTLTISEKFPISILKERVTLLLQRAELEKAREETQPSAETTIF